MVRSVEKKRKHFEVHGAQVWDSMHGIKKKDLESQSAAFTLHSSMGHASFGSSVASRIQVANVGSHCSTAVCM